VRAAQLRASLAVNRELVLLYWGIGRDILARQKEQGWGAKIIDRLAADLRQEFPEVTGFSPRNLKYMRALAEAWPDEPIVQQLAAQIPWFHNCAILDIDRGELLRVLSLRPRYHLLPIRRLNWNIRMLLMPQAVAGLEVARLETFQVLAQRRADQRRTVHSRPPGGSVCGAQ